MRTHRKPVIVPEDLSADTAISPLVRAVIATGLAALDKTAHASEHARRRFGDDRALELVLRAATTPATLAGNPALAHVVVAFLETLVPVSAGADLLARGIGLNFAGVAQINVPGIAVPTADFVGEGAPIPVVQAPTSAGPTLTHMQAELADVLEGIANALGVLDDRLKKIEERRRTNKTARKTAARPIAPPGFLGPKRSEHDPTVRYT